MLVLFEERQQLLDVLHSKPFADKAPAEAYTRLLDQDQYLCSIRTMYHVLDSRREVRERHDQLRHPIYNKPQLVATVPHQVWSSGSTSRRKTPSRLTKMTELKGATCRAGRRLG